MSADQPLLGALFRIPFQVLNDRIEQSLREHGYHDLRPAYFEVFRHLESGGSRSTKLAERAQITKQSMGYLIDYLEENGYVQRAPDPRDRRAKLVQLTAKGKAVEQTARDIIQQVEQEWADKLGREKMGRLRYLLEELITFLETETR